MWLRDLKVRVKKYPEGYVVEIEKTRYVLGLFPKRYWTHLISVLGMPEQPWFYTTESVALSQAAKYFRWDLLFYANVYADD